MAMAFVAICGSSAPESTESTGYSCSDYNAMIRVEFMIGDDCDYDEDCDQVIPVEDTCPTADRLLSSDFDSEYLRGLIDDAEADGCTVRYPGDRGDCDPESIPVCEVGQCIWM